MGSIGKPINDLVKIINNDHKISMNDEDDVFLLNMGYYHGYKAFKHINYKKDLPINDFEDIKCLYELDNNLKLMFYEVIMKIETAIKNRIVDILVSNKKSSIDSYISSLFKEQNDTQNNKIKKKEKHTINEDLFKIKYDIDSILRNNYRNRGVVKYYVDKNKEIPIWVVIDLMTIGNLCNLIKRLPNDIGKEISTIILKDEYKNYESINVLNELLWLINNLRNAVAHNEIIFDCRFRNGKPTKGMKEFFYGQLMKKNEKFCSEDSFESIVDYVIIVCYLMYILDFNKDECINFFKKFINILNDFSSEISNDIYKMIFDKKDYEKISFCIEKFDEKIDIYLLWDYYD